MYIIFVEFTIGFGTVGMPMFVAAAVEKWMPRTFAKHDTGIMVNVRDGGEISHIFVTAYGVRKGGVLAPTLLFFSYQ